MKESKKKLVVLIAAVLFIPLFWFGTAGKPVKAATVSTWGYGTAAVSNNGDKSVHVLGRYGIPTGQVLHDETTETTGGSGVEKLDEAADRTNKLVTWVCAWVGGLMALFGIIWAAINQASHNSEGRNQGIIVGAIGIVVAFAPQITNMILGK